MIYPAPLLPDLLVGWQKVADRYNMPIYVSQTGDTGSRGWPLHVERRVSRGESVGDGLQRTTMSPPPRLHQRPIEMGGHP